MMDKADVVVNHVCVTIHKKSILRDVSLECYPGRCTGIYGHNGSGKSMLLKAICGLIQFKCGEIHVLDRKVGVNGQFPQKTGCLIENPGFLDQYSGLKNLEILASIHKTVSKESICNWMKRFALDPENRNKYKTYSLGMRQKLGIVQAMMEDQQVVILDEPTNNLDSAAKETLFQVIKELTSMNKTVLIVSHDMEEITRACNDVYEMDEGVITKRR